MSGTLGVRSTVGVRAGRTAGSCMQVCRSKEYVYCEWYAWSKKYDWSEGREHYEENGRLLHAGYCRLL